MSVNEELYNREAMTRLEQEREPRTADAAANCKAPTGPDPMLGAEARQVGAPVTCALTKAPDAQQVPASYVHGLARGLERIEAHVKHLVHSTFGQDLTEYPSLVQRLGRVERDVKAVTEMAHQACHTSNRNYSDLTNLQEGKALRESSGLLMLTVERVRICEQDIHDIYGRLDVLEEALDYCVPDSRCITSRHRRRPQMQDSHLQGMLAEMSKRVGEATGLTEAMRQSVPDPDFSEVGEPPIGTPARQAWQRRKNAEAAAACDRVLIGVDPARGRDVGVTVTATVNGNDAVRIDGIRYER